MNFILFLALFLRLTSLNQSLWLDEAFQYKATHNFSLFELLTVYLPQDFNPPLSYLMNFFFSRLFGWSEIALRLPSVIFGVVTVYLVFLISQHLNFKKPLWPALLLATSSLHLYYSQEARMYSLACFAVTGSIFYFLKILKKQTKPIYYLFFNLLVIYSHYLTWFIFPAQLMAVYKLQKKSFKKILKYQIISLLGFIPWLPFFITQLKTGLQASQASSIWSSTVGGLTLKNLSLIPIKFLIGRISIDNHLIYALALFLPIVLSAYVLIKAYQNKNSNKPAFFTLFSWALIPLFLIILVSIKVPVLVYFRLLFILPAFYLILSFGLENFKKTKAYLLFIFFLSLNFISSGIYLFCPRFHREDWKSLTRVLSQKNPQMNPVYIIPVVDAPLKYYYSGNIKATDHFQPSKVFWYVPYAEPIFDPQQKFRQSLKSAGFSQDFMTHFQGSLTLIKYTQ